MHNFGQSLLFGMLCLCGLASSKSASAGGIVAIEPEGEALAARLDAFHVEQHWLRGDRRVRWRTGDVTPESDGQLPPKLLKDETHCSAFAAAAAEKLGVYLLHPPEHSQVLLASAQADWLPSEAGRSAGWKALTMAIEAQSAANAGQLVLAVFKSPDVKKPGHIAIIRPADVTVADLARTGPRITQAGFTNFQNAALADGFAHHPGAWNGDGWGGVKFFTHPLEDHASAPPSPLVQTFSGPTMGSKYHITVTGLPPLVTIDNLKREVHTRLGQINLELSTYLPQSEISKFNAHNSTDWFPVTANVARLVEYALKLSADSKGAFDPTIGPVVNLWGFGPEPPPDHAPTAEQLAAVLEHVGYDKLEVRQNPPALRKLRSQLQLDLSAIGQGYATDEVFAMLDDLGVHGILVDVTGEIRATGCKPNGARWRVAIESPGSKQANRTIELEDESLATSGSTHNFYEFDGVRYSHTMNPRTGRPVTHNLVSVTVRAKRCLDADAWATTLMVLGPEEGFKWAEERKIAALLVEQVGDEFRERMTSTWTRLSETRSLQSRRDRSTYAHFTRAS